MIKLIQAGKHWSDYVDSIWKQSAGLVHQFIRLEQNNDGSWTAIYRIPEEAPHIVRCFTFRWRLDNHPLTAHALKKLNLVTVDEKSSKNADCTSSNPESRSANKAGGQHFTDMS